jgi:hypothetical protein
MVECALDAARGRGKHQTRNAAEKDADANQGADNPRGAGRPGL